MVVMGGGVGVEDVLFTRIFRKAEFFLDFRASFYLKFFVCKTGILKFVVFVDIYIYQSM